jgi:hypothetical protein
MGRVCLVVPIAHRVTTSTNVEGVTRLGCFRWPSQARRTSRALSSKGQGQSAGASCIFSQVRVPCRFLNQTLWIPPCRTLRRCSPSPHDLSIPYSIPDTPHRY